MLGRAVNTGGTGAGPLASGWPGDVTGEGSPLLEKRGARDGTTGVLGRRGDLLLPPGGAGRGGAGVLCWWLVVSCRWLVVSSAVLGAGAACCRGPVAGHEPLVTNN